jgi:penicillin G amidase
MTQLKKITSRALIVLAAFLLLISLLILDRFGAARRSVDSHEGTLHLAGLSQDAEIIRDINSVPHIYGTSEADVSFALGVAHAQDRLWQMELFRRVGQGRLSEIFGSFALPADRYVRTLGLYRLATQSLPHLKPETREILDAYAAGVNAYLSDREAPLPPEFLFLVHEPEPWTAADSVVMIKLLALGLSGNATRELSRARLAEVLSADQTAQFLPSYPGDAPVALKDLASLFSNTPLERAALFIPDTGPKGASNNWVVDGQWTSSGKPLLANDPHLGMLAPSIWYLAHLAYPDRNVVGATIAGVPSVILGRNDHIAWGYTNTGPDTQDLYIEKLNPDNANQYLTPNGFVDFDQRVETISVRFGSDVSLRVRSTRHGPVLPTDFFGADELTPEGHVISLAWSALSEQDRTIEAGHEITRAQNFTQFKQALRTYVAPMQNMVFANIEGEIGFIAPAVIPIRGPLNEGAGLIPTSGWQPENDWTGFIPFDALPQAHNPSSGTIVTANHKIVLDSYPHLITHQWDLPYRAARIEDLLATSKEHTVQSFLEMQMDNGSYFAERFVPLLLAQVPDVSNTREVLERLAAWNHHMDGDMAEPLIFTAWMREVARLVYADELEDQFSGNWRFHPIFLEAVLTDQDGQSKWCDDVTTVPTAETCGAVIRQGLSIALEKLNERYGADISQWAWADAHPVVNRHIPGSFIPLLGDALTITRPSSGGNHTINRGQHQISSDNPFDNVHAAGFRAVYDLNNLNASRYMTSTGQSGNPYSPAYDAFASGWAEGGSILIETERDKISAMSQISLHAIQPVIE